MAWRCEYTDTFAGEANYSWVRRALIADGGGNESQASLMRRAKAALGINGLRGRTHKQSGTGDYEFRPWGVCAVAFISWDDWSDDAQRVDESLTRAA